MRGLVVGRFQPLHKGHEAVIRRAIEDCVHVVVAIGSSQAKQSVQDPFTLEERQEMIRAVFGDAVEVFAVPDIHDPPRWVGHLTDITGPVDKVFGNDERTVSLFEDEGIPVVRSGLKDREALEGKTIRLKMAEGDGMWRKSVPAPVVERIDAWDVPVRLRRLEAML